MHLFLGSDLLTNLTAALSGYGTVSMSADLSVCLSASPSAPLTVAQTMIVSVFLSFRICLHVCAEVECIRKRMLKPRRMS